MNFVVDDIGRVVESMRTDSYDYSLLYNPASELRPYYMYGHRVEIANRLKEMENDSVYKYRKYPLIALRLDIPETVKGGLWHYSLNIAILDFTDKQYIAPERYENVIKPVLYPLYTKFFKNLRESGLFMWEGMNDMEYPEHTKVDRPFWGTEGKEGNQANIFADPLDAIEIIDLKIAQRVKCDD